jgi:hypothetical protein
MLRTISSVLFYLFRVNLSTKMYVSHPVYWEAMEIGKKMDGVNQVSKYFRSLLVN